MRNYFKTRMIKILLLCAGIFISNVCFSQTDYVLAQGKVVDKKGYPLPGAQIMVPGTSIATITDLDGNYTLNVPKNSSLTASFMGYKTQSVPSYDSKEITLIKYMYGSRFFWNIDLGSSNLWSAIIMDMVNSGISALTNTNNESEWVSLRTIKDNDLKVPMSYYGGGINANNYWERRFLHDKEALKFKRIFSNCTFGGKIGYDFASSIVSLYASIHYSVESFETRFIRDDQTYRHKIQMFQPGIGVRISPLLANNYVSPLLELGYAQDVITKYSGIYGNDKNQLLEGGQSTFGIGLKNRRGDNMIFKVICNGHELFNKDYSPDGGHYYPYANLKSNKITFMFSEQFRIFNN